MEAVESATPVTPPCMSKLMGSEVVGRARVDVGGAENSESGLNSSKTETFSSLVSQRGTVGTSASSSWTKETSTKTCRSESHLLGLARGDVLEALDHGPPNSSVMSMTGSEVKLLQQKAGKVPRNGNGPLRRQRTTQMDNQISQDESAAVKVSSDKIGLHPVKCSNAERTPGLKPRTNLNSKRSDRRVSKAPPKAVLLSCGAGPGVNNVFGMYGLKPDVNDLTKFVEDISLNELLDGSYKCPALGKDKGKKHVNMNDTILHSVRKACSVLGPRGSPMSNQPDEMDCLNKKAPELPLSSTLHVRSDSNCSNAQSSEATDFSSHEKVQESPSETNAPADTIDDALLCEPKDILDRLALPQSKDLESLLLDASKAGPSLRCTDLRQGKSLSHRVGLPPFPWSHNHNGHCKSNSDAAKLSSRTPCQGKWVSIGNPAIFFGGGTVCSSVDLGSLTYDDSLVPSGGNKYSLPQSGIALSRPVSLPEQGAVPAICRSDSKRMASLTCLPPSEEHGTSLDDKLKGPQSPGLLTAAQTLCDIANYGSTYCANGIIKWPKQPSQKGMKARKSRSNEKPEDIPKACSGTMPDNRVSEHGSSHKKPRLSGGENKEEIRFVTALRAPIFWSGPRASRSSPSRSSRDVVVGAKQCNGSSTVKQSVMNPPPPRVVDKATSRNNQPKVRKVMQMDWNRTKT